MRSVTPGPPRGAPARQVIGQELDGAESALATAQGHRVGHVGAQGPRLAGEVARAQQVADVGDNPVGGGLDEEIVVEGLDVGVDSIERSLEDLDVGLQRALRQTLLLPDRLIADAVDLRQSRVEGDAVAWHQLSSWAGPAAIWTRR